MTTITATTPEGTVTMNTTTHDICAAYTIEGTEWHEIDTNGDDFAEIVADLLDFWNAADNRAAEFTIDRTFNPDDFTTVAEIVGTLYGYRDGEVTTDIVDTVIVHVTATER